MVEIDDVELGSRVEETRQSVLNGWSKSATSLRPYRRTNTSVYDSVSERCLNIRRLGTKTCQVDA